MSLPSMPSYESGGGGINFHTPSPLTGRDRQTGPIRVPHFDMKPMTRSYMPRSERGEVHPRYRATAMDAGNHFDYVTSGAVLTPGKHLDYIRRDTAVEHLEEELVIDMLDEQEIRHQQNAFAIYSNIDGGRERQRSLFEAAERCERQPKKHHLTAFTADLPKFEYLGKFAFAPQWLRDMERRLRAALREAERKAAVAGKEFKHFQAEIADVTQEQAFERLTWLDRYRLASAVSWKQGRTGRSHYRFVLELPEGAMPAERYRILRAFCDMLARDGWMVVGAIHQPDPHGDKRNFHIHVDGYDRPARWLEEHGCWDFEHVVRRNGKNTFPDRQKKVRYELPPNASGKTPKADTATMMRERFIDIVANVIGDQPDVVRYVPGTYKDNGIGLTPLEHMGNRTSALEGRGIVTDVGLCNARRIVKDELVACERRAKDQQLGLDSDLASARALLTGDAEALAAIERYEKLERQLIQRRLAGELADVVFNMARSRADAVIATLAPRPGRRPKLRHDDLELLAGARAHLAWVKRHSPSANERAAERRRLAGIEAQVKAAWEPIEDAIARAPDDSAWITYMPTPRSASHAASFAHPRFEQQVRERLRRWLVKHADDPAKLVFEGAAVCLGPRVPPTIDTMMRRLAGDALIQQLLSAARERREAGASAATAGLGQRQPAMLIGSAGSVRKNTVHSNAAAPATGERAEAWGQRSSDCGVVIVTDQNFEPKRRSRPNGVVNQTDAIFSSGARPPLERGSISAKGPAASSNRTSPIIDPVNEEEGATSREWNVDDNDTRRLARAAPPDHPSRPSAPAARSARTIADPRPPRRNVESLGKGPASNSEGGTAWDRVRDPRGPKGR